MRKTLYFSACLNAFWLFSDSCAMQPAGLQQLVPVGDLQVVLVDTVNTEEAAQRLGDAFQEGSDKLDASIVDVEKNSNNGPVLKRICEKFGLSLERNRSEMATKIRAEIARRKIALEALKRTYEQQAKNPGFNAEALDKACNALASGNPEDERHTEVATTMTTRAQQLMAKAERAIADAQAQGQGEGVFVGVMASAERLLLDGGVPESFVAVILRVLAILSEERNIEIVGGLEQYRDAVTRVTNLLSMAGKEAENVFKEEVLALIGKADVNVVTHAEREKILDKYTVNFVDFPADRPQEAQRSAFKLLSRMFVLLRVDADPYNLPVPMAPNPLTNPENPLLRTVAAPPVVPDGIKKIELIRISPEAMGAWKEIVKGIMGRRDILPERQGDVLKAITGSINNGFKIPTLGEAIVALAKNPGDEDLLFKVESGKDAFVPSNGMIEIPNYGDSDCLPYDHGPREVCGGGTSWGGEHPTLDEIRDAAEKTPEQRKVVCFLAAQQEAPYPILPPLVSPDLNKYPEGSEGVYRKLPGARLDFRNRVSEGRGEIKVAVPLPAENWDAMYTNGGVRLPIYVLNGRQVEVKYPAYTGEHKPWLCPIEYLNENLSQLEGENFPFLNRSQVALIPSNILNGLSQNQIQLFTNVVIHHFHPDQIRILFPRLTAWQLNYISPDAMSEITWHMMRERYAARPQGAIKEFPVTLIPYIGKTPPPIAGGRPAAVAGVPPPPPPPMMAVAGVPPPPPPPMMAAAGVPPPPPPPMMAAAGAPPPPPPPMAEAAGRRPRRGAAVPQQALPTMDDADVDGLNFCFMGMSSVQIHAIPSRFIPHLKANVLFENGKLSLLNREQWISWASHNASTIQQYLEFLTPAHCACLSGDIIPNLIRGMSFEQVAALTPEQLSNVAEPFPANVANIVVQKKEAPLLKEELAKILGEATREKGAERKKILEEKRLACFWEGKKRFDVRKIEIDFSLEQQTDLSEPEADYFFVDFAEAKKHRNVAYTLVENKGQEGKQNSFLAAGGGIFPVTVRRGLQTQLSEGWLIIDAAVENKKVTIILVKPQDAQPGDTTLQDYLLENFNDVDKERIEKVRTGHISAKQLKLKMPRVRALMREEVVMPELGMLALQHDNDADKEEKEQFGLRLAHELNRMYLNSAYLLCDEKGKFLYIPPADIRKIKELKGEALTLRESVILSNAKVQVGEESNDEVVFKRVDVKYLKEPSDDQKEIELPAGEKYVYCGQKKIELENEYSSQHGMPTTVRPLKSLYQLGINKCRIILTTEESKYKDKSAASPRPIKSLAPTLWKLFEFSKKYGGYWHATSALQRNAIRDMDQEVKDEFEPYLLPEDVNSDDKVFMYILQSSQASLFKSQERRDQTMAQRMQAIIDELTEIVRTNGAGIFESKESFYVALGVNPSVSMRPQIKQGGPQSDELKKAIVVDDSAARLVRMKGKTKEREIARLVKSGKSEDKATAFVEAVDAKVAESGMPRNKAEEEVLKTFRWN